MDLGVRLSESANAVVWSHFIGRLRTYHDNLRGVIEAEESDWLPFENHLLLGQLSDYLFELGHAEIDPYLIRYGLTVPGQFMRIQPPILALQENRGGLSKRRASQAAGQISRILEALAISNWFLADLSQNTGKAIVQLITLLDSKTGNDGPTDLELYANLRDDESNELSEYTLLCLDCSIREAQDIGKRILQNLACLRESPLPSNMLNNLIDRLIFYPPQMYLNAEERVADTLIKQLEQSEGSSSTNHLLLALAWTRSSKAAQAFSNWKSSHPSWAADLNIPVENYPHEAGWYLNSDQEFESLISLKCYELQRWKKEIETLLLQQSLFRCKTHLQLVGHLCGFRTQNIPHAQVVTHQCHLLHNSI